jgi:hypothetical protein
VIVENICVTKSLLKIEDDLNEMIKVDEEALEFNWK